MNDIRRTVLWVIFGFSMVLLWDQWQISHGHKATFFQGQPVKIDAASVAPAQPASDASIPSGTVPVAAAAPAAVPADTAPAKIGERFTVSTDVLKLRFDTQGGTLVGSEFVRYGDNAEKSKIYVLLDDSIESVF